MSSLPVHAAISVLDLDVTKRCNLQCKYCFKNETVSPLGCRMPLRTALTAADWLIEASLGARHLNINLMGGEPLLEWVMVQQLVPYAKRRASQFAKTIQFGTTTNLTLIDPHVIAFSKRWGMGWHCSIDGIPRVQDTQRPFVGGAGTSRAAERGARQVLGYRPACGRATILPENVSSIYESVQYLYSVGFRGFAFALADEPRWGRRELLEFHRQWTRVTDFQIECFRRGEVITVAGIDYVVRAHVAGRQEQTCGAGRGMALIDARGDVWPCNRWDGADLESQSGGQWKFANIFERGFNHKLHVALLERDHFTHQRASCRRCSARPICGGGCPAANLTSTGDIYTQHRAMCEMTRVLYAEGLRFYDTLKAEGNALLLKTFKKENTNGNAARSS
ncbi:MAG: radical SAM protein [Planctomycetota bacterium]